MVKNILLVGIGGGCGSILRYLMSVLTTKYYWGTFPLSTFIVNLLGCLLIGVLIGLSSRLGVISPDVKLLLITGFCGGYTTFSTFSSENLYLYQGGFYLMLILYVISSVLLGCLAVYLGILLSK